MNNGIINGDDKVYTQNKNRLERLLEPQSGIVIEIAKIDLEKSKAPEYYAPEPFLFA